MGGCQSSARLLGQLAILVQAEAGQVLLAVLAVAGVAEDEASDHQVTGLEVSL